MTAGVPVAAAGTVAQTITQTFDPSRVQLTGASGIVAPSGWTLTYSSDGTTFGAAPVTPAGWAAIRAVRATGSIQSGGDANGLQIASGTGTGSVPVSGAFTSGGGGDGWDVAFDERGNVFNTFHHDGYWGSGFITPGLHCHTRTGGSCGPGWPFALRIPNGTMGPDGISGQPWYHTNEQAMEWVDTVNNRVWIPTSLNDGTAASGTGFVCVDVSDLATGPGWCGGSIRNAFVKLGPTLCGRDCTLGLAAAGGKLFAWDAGTGDLLCVDPQTNRAGGLPGAPCAGQPFAIGTIAATSLANGYSLMAAQGLVWGSSEGKAACFNPDTLTMCSGFSSGPVSLTGTYPNTMFDVPTATGLPGAVCFARYDASRGCFEADGTSSTELTGTHAGTAFMSYLSTRMTTTITPKNGVTAGSRVYWSDGAWPGGGKIYCWDKSLSSGTGAACANWPVNVSAYTATVDAQNQNCIWTNTDSGAITTIDAITGGSTCTTPPPVAEFSAPVIVPRLACSNAASIQQWGSFKLTAPAASTYSTANLTVLTATGSVLPGWNRVSIPAGSRTVDLSSLAVSTSGTAPRFRVTLNDKTTNDAISAEVVAIGDAPQLCLPLQTVAACPAGPARIAGALATPSPITVTGSGSAQPAVGPLEQFNSAVASVSVSAPSDASCLGTISGTATMQSTATPVAGALVRLVNSSGAVVATATTDASGNYTFDRLIATSGYRVQFGPASQGSANASTVAAATTDRTVAVNTTTTVNGVYGVLRTNALSGSAQHNQPVTLTPSPTDSNGSQTYASFTKSSTCIVDPADGACKTTVTISGQGTWTAGSSAGTLVFTPVNGYSGTTTSLDYRVTETTSSWTTWNTAVATIAAAPTTTTTSTTVLAASPSTSVPVASIATPSQPVVATAQSVTRATRTGSLVTSVWVPGPGQLTQSAVSAAITACRSMAVTVVSSGPVSTSCQLTGPARWRLRNTAVTVTLVTRFVSKSGAVRVTRTRVVLPRVKLLPVTR